MSEEASAITVSSVRHGHIEQRMWQVPAEQAEELAKELTARHGPPLSTLLTTDQAIEWGDQIIAL